MKVVMLDEIMKMHLRGVQAPSSDYITIYDNKVNEFEILKFMFFLVVLEQSLKDMKTACEKLPLDQVSNLIEKDPHPQLW